MKQQGHNLKENKGFTRLSNEMQKHEVYWTLSASALRVFHWCLYRNFNAATNKIKGDLSGPSFKLTQAEARDKLGMSPQVFHRAKTELTDKGFLKVKVQGGLSGVNGVPSEYQLSNDWKGCKATRNTKDMKAARKALARKRSTQ